MYLVENKWISKEYSPKDLSPKYRLSISFFVVKGWFRKGCAILWDCEDIWRGVQGISEEDEEADLVSVLRYCEIFPVQSRIKNVLIIRNRDYSN